MLPFVKMHALGNDYVYLNAVANPALAARRDLPRLARAISDRHRGVGSDGLILVCRPRHDPARDRRGAHIAMRMFNADGSESPMCGNGVRCVAKFAHDRLGIRRNPMLVETKAGLVAISYRTSRGKLTTAAVDMGEPILQLQNIPVDRQYLTRGRKPFEWKLELAGRGGGEVLATFVSMGNPHAVIFPADSLDHVDLPNLGPQIEDHPAFPDRANIHFVDVHRKSEASMITWERGTGPTLACGSGACAVLVAGVLTGRLARSATLHLPGGDLRIQWDEATNRVIMTGPASEAYEGVWPEKARVKDKRRA